MTLQGYANTLYDARQSTEEFQPSMEETWQLYLACPFAL